MTPTTIEVIGAVLFGIAIIHTFSVEQQRLPGRHRTSGDLVRALTGTALPAPALAATTAWLTRCDLVKYAAERVDDDGAGALGEARQLVVAAAGPAAEAPHA